MVWQEEEVEVPCRVYTSKVGELYAGESGWVAIKKNDVVYIPDMCQHKSLQLLYTGPRMAWGSSI